MGATIDSPGAEVFADPYQHWRKNLLLIERVRELSTLRPGRVVFDTVRCWCIILAAWTIVALWPQWWVVLLAIPVIGSRYYALFIIGRVLLFGIDTPGYASLLIVVLAMGAIQLVSIGLIGEYLGRLFREVKGRPIYVVEGVYEEQPPQA